MTARTGVWVGLILATVLVAGCGPRATEDWRAGNSGARTVSYIGSHARPNAVILMHQVHNTYTVLEEIFRTLHEQGYTCVRLDELPRYPANIGG